MKTKYLIISVILILLIISACQGENQKSEFMPGIDLPVEEMNIDLHLLSHPDLNTFKMGDFVWLTLYNTSNLPVVLGPDYGVHIFKIVDGQWEEIENRMEDAPGDIWVLANGDETRWFEAITVFPEAFYLEPVQIRVVIIGNQVKANGRLGKEVGAYVDVTLNPK